MLILAKRMLNAKSRQDVLSSANGLDMGNSESGRARTALSLLSKVRAKPHTRVPVHITSERVLH